MKAAHRTAGAAPRPDPAAIYAVPLGASPVVGSPKARVTMVMAFEFACPYCRKAFDTVDDLRKKYGKDLRVVYKQFVVHPQIATADGAAPRAPRTARAAGASSPDLLWVKAFDARSFDPANIDALATEARSRHAPLPGGPRRHVPARRSRTRCAALTKVGVNATPTFFINGRYPRGRAADQSFSTLIDEELAKAKAAEKRGVAPERYYDQEVLAKGLTELAP